MFDSIISKLLVLPRLLRSIFIEKLGSSSFSCSSPYNYIEKPFRLFARTHVRTTTGGKIARAHVMAGKQCGILTVAYYPLHTATNMQRLSWLLIGFIYLVFFFAWDKCKYTSKLIISIPLKMLCFHNDLVKEHPGYLLIQKLSTQINKRYRLPKNELNFLTI